MKVDSAVHVIDKNRASSLGKNALKINKQNVVKNNDSSISVGKIKRNLRLRNTQRHKLRLLHSDLSEDESVTMKKIIETYECTVNDVISGSDDDSHLYGDRYAYVSEKYI